MTTNEQLELGFKATQTRVAGRRAVRLARAQWWFAQIRATVENAMAWESPDRSQPEQIWITGANRQLKA